MGDFLFENMSHTNDTNKLPSLHNRLVFDCTECVFDERLGNNDLQIAFPKYSPKRLIIAESIMVSVI